eukprot:387805_1
MNLNFRGCLLGSTVETISGSPICCTESCIIVHTIHDNDKSKSHHLKIIGHLPLELEGKSYTDLNQLLCNLLELQCIHCSCVGIGTNCMMIAMDDPSQNKAHSMVLIGDNEHGNLGISSINTTNIATPKVIPMAQFLNTPNRIKRILCRERYSLLLDDCGNVYQCKNTIQPDDLKSDGDDAVVSMINPIHFNNEKMIQIGAGLVHNIALSHKSNVYCWGSNLYHCCGAKDGKYPNIISHFISPLIKVTLVDCGLWHCCVMTAIGDVYTWGLNRDGQLGVGKDITHSKTPVLVAFDDVDDVECVSMSSGARHIAVIDNKHRLWAWGYNKFAQIVMSSDAESIHIWTPLQIKTEANLRFVKCGHWYTLCGF